MPAANQSDIESLTLGMGCFWGPEALFGHLPGVIRTRTGYAGGTTPDPTYREMGDHSETVEVQFDPAQITLAALLDVFWTNHNPANINGYKGRQYWSILLFRDSAQQEAIRQAAAERAQIGGLGRAREEETEIAPFHGFYPAEERHQKYYLKRYPDAIAKLSSLYPNLDDLHNSTLAARLNGLAKGYTNRARIEQEIAHWQADSSSKEKMLHTIRQIRW
ncbi:peptide-methionine (S)-S-oxide reductase MsrA [Paenibacillus gansuensis]|uniref:Peptide methionine sulfoxide reductase MsrA n=1 Tax=Paenibacillus gansuensis TaxID=306542 RepID=A0ABW5PF97_9BACL